MEYITTLADGFMNLFERGGEVFVSLVTGIVPLLICLLVAMNALVRFVGEKRVERLASKSGKNVVARYLFLPTVGTFFFANQ